MPTRPAVHRPVTARPSGVRVHEVQPTQPERYGQGRGGRPWRRLRKAVMDRDSWLCQTCKRAGKHRLATQVDHVKPLAQGGTDDPDNLEAICDPCHARKTGREAKGLRV